MNQVKQIDRSTLKHIVRPALDRKLAELSSELGIEITSGGASYDPGGKNATFKLNLAIVDESGVVMTPERQDFITHGDRFGLTKEMLDQELVLGGHTVRVIGLKLRATKNNVLLETTDSSRRQLVAPAAIVRAAYRRSLAA